MAGKALSDMIVEDWIEAANRRKAEGNAYFKDEKLEEAMQQYEMALAYMGGDFMFQMFQLFGEYRDMALAVKNPCHLNMAACFVKLERYEEAIAQCSIVLSVDENNVKALFRRGKARAELGQMDAAREDFQKARKFAPEDKVIAKELRMIAEHDKAVYQKQKEIYKGIFGPRPEPKELRMIAEHDKAVYQKQKEIYEGIFGPRPEPKPKSLSWLVLIWQWLVSIVLGLFKLKKNKAD